MALVIFHCWSISFLKTSLNLVIGLFALKESILLMKPLFYCFAAACYG